MRLDLALSADERVALIRLAAEIGCSTEDAAKTALRDWLIERGYLGSAEADNDNGDAETKGEA